MRESTVCLFLYHLQSRDSDEIYAHRGADECVRDTDMCL